MTSLEQKLAAKEFEEKWAEGGKENQHTQVFWLTFLRDVYGIENPEEIISFEKSVDVENIGTEKGNTKRIDGYIANTQVLIEQKDSTKSLTKKYSQSDGARLNAFEQADRYGKNLNHDENPRWIITCNFLEFRIYDMNRRGSEPEVIKLSELSQKYNQLAFLTDEKAEQIKQEQSVSLGAGEIVGRLYDALYEQYPKPVTEEKLRSLNILCVRLVFCLYSEDAGIFSHGQFRNYLKNRPAERLRRDLKELFKVLDQKAEDREDEIEEELSTFPYVNGGLFDDKPFGERGISIPQFTPGIVELLIHDASEQFDWSKISPTIFGAVFESTLNPDTRKKGGMHYTSVENIHKVIDPLFLDELHKELATAKKRSIGGGARTKAMQMFQNRIASLKFLDPACGSGNFLTETYLSLRRMENEVIQHFLRDQEQTEFAGGRKDWIKVSIGQFYGIEVNDFAVAVARTALWIAEIQMKQETENILRIPLDFLPLKSNPNIIEENALTYPWEELVNRDELSYIMGNPPFRGYSEQSDKQKAEIREIYVDEKGSPYKSAGKVDYVASWFFKAAQFLYGTEICAGFVATNSITQGEQAAGVWKPLYERFGIHIDFAHRTFTWNSESNDIAHVHCVIIGFSSKGGSRLRKIYTEAGINVVEYIDPYLADRPTVFVESRRNAICDVPKMVYGNKPADGGFLLLSAAERIEAIQQESGVEKYIKRIYGSTEYINNQERYCLWLVDIPANELRQYRFIRERVKKVKEERLNSKKAATRRSASTPYLFQEIRQPDSAYIIVPCHSSETRRYIPCGFLEPDIIVNNAVLIIPDAKIYHFGVLVSDTHMNWMRAIGGRIKSDYRYSKDVVYNNFPWPTPTAEQKDKIEQTAKGILDVRAKNATCSLADLYDSDFMPDELQKAHQQNDKAVWEAYGKAWPFGNEEACVRWLMERYQELISNHK